MCHLSEMTHTVVSRLVVTPNNPQIIHGNKTAICSLWIFIQFDVTL